MVFFVYVSDIALVAYHLTLNDAGVPRVTASITLKDDFTVTVSLNAVVVPASQFPDMCCDNKVQYISQILNLMARLKSWSENPQSIPSETTLIMAILLLK